MIQLASGRDSNSIFSPNTVSWWAFWDVMFSKNLTFSPVIGGDEIGPLSPVKLAPAEILLYFNIGGWTSTNTKPGFPAWLPYYRSRECPKTFQRGCISWWLIHLCLFLATYVALMWFSVVVKSITSGKQIILDTKKKLASERGSCFFFRLNWVQSMHSSC